MRDLKHAKRNLSLHAYEAFRWVFFGSRRAENQTRTSDFAVSAARRVYFFFVSIWLSSLAGAETEISTDNT